MPLIKLLICLFLTNILLYSSTLVFFGDSLTAGYNIAKKDAFPALINEKIATDHITVINAGISGDTTFTLLNRLDWTINQTQPSIAFVSIGANDGLRGYDVNIIKSNIQLIIDKLNTANINIILGGMSLPENYSEAYISSFESIYSELASENSILLMPFLLADVAGIDNYNLTDRIHPNELGHQVIADNVLNFLVTNNVIIRQKALK